MGDGIHELMSFTVARRTREIGIRIALGARPGRIVATIFSRVFFQIARAYSPVDDWLRCGASDPKRLGKSGRYFNVLKWASEYGLSVDV